jgi:putative transposase
VQYHLDNPLAGYRRLTYMMLDNDIVAVSAATTYRVLKEGGLLQRWSRPTKKGTGFQQPEGPHQHWHMDITYLNLGGTFYYLCMVLDGYSRFIVHWEIRPSMKEQEVECILQRAVEKFPAAKPRIISDNGPQFIAKDFKTYIREAGMTHVRTSPYYPQSNGKLERTNKTLKVEAIRVAQPETLEEAIKVVETFVTHYNEERLHSALGYITPSDCLAGRGPAIQSARDQKLEAARAKRQEERRRLRLAQAPTQAVAA